VIRGGGADVRRDRRALRSPRRPRQQCRIGQRFDRLTDIDDETWRQTLAVNLDGAFFCLRGGASAAGGRRRAHREISVRCRATRGPSAHYAASKAGLLALTAKAARELARDGISVNAVLPSVIETEMPRRGRSRCRRALA
jgi:NAD(P)-dependent dehydrogenase (short-subunit alcohol dehydrogenase family)